MCLSVEHLAVYRLPIMIFPATNLLEKSDAELWDLYRSGSQDAYNLLIKRYTKPLIIYGFRICQDRDLAKDCVQEVFLDLWRRRDRINSVQAVKAYLFKCVRFKIFRDRSLWKENEVIEDNNQFAIEFNIETKLIEDTDLRELSLKIKNILNSLPPRQQEVMYLRFFENLNLDQISEAMNISKQSVNNLLQKAYKNFRSEWVVFFLLSPEFFFS